MSTDKIISAVTFCGQAHVGLSTDGNSADYLQTGPRGPVHTVTALFFSSVKTLSSRLSALLPFVKTGPRRCPLTRRTSAVTFCEDRPTGCPLTIISAVTFCEDRPTGCPLTIISAVTFCEDRPTGCPLTRSNSASVGLSSL